MGLKDQIAADRATFINPDEFGEAVDYRPSDGSPDIPIVALVELLESPDDTGDSLRNFAEIWVKAADIAAPVRGDIVFSGGLLWSVIRISETDSGGLHCLECEANMRPGFGRSRYA